MATTEAQAILQRLAEMGCTDGDVAEATGIHRVTVCRIRNHQLSGDRSLPKLREIVQELGPEFGLDLPLQQPEQGQHGSSPRATPHRPRSLSAAAGAAAREEEAGVGGFGISGRGWLVIVGGLAVAGILGLAWWSNQNADPYQQQSDQPA